MIWLAYCGYCWPTASALAKDYVSSAETLSVTYCALGDAPIAAAAAAA